MSLSLSAVLSPVVSMPSLGLEEDQDNCFMTAGDDDLMMNMMDFDFDAILNEAVATMDHHHHHNTLNDGSAAVSALNSPSPTVALTASPKLVSPVMIPTNMDTCLIDDDTTNHKNSMFSSTPIMIPNPLSHLFSTNKNTSPAAIASPSTQPLADYNKNSNINFVDIAPRDTANVSPSPSNDDGSNSNYSYDYCITYKTPNNNKRKRDLSDDSITAHVTGICPKKPAPMNRVTAVTTTEMTSPPTHSFFRYSNSTASSSSPVSAFSSSNRRKSTSSSATSVTGVDETIKKERNRMHAKASRQRRKELMGELQQSLQSLQEENQTLLRFLSNKWGGRTTQQALMKEQAKPAERLIEQLKQPNARILNTKTIRFLQDLRKELPPLQERKENNNIKSEESIDDTLFFQVVA
ncbi:bZIP basic region leucine zipper domain containing protein [Nitzschia inconspicua]|uniref:BZIP basic region leucine zipper domain containing protein n=1 Tax=Nitzschia inconspicua TaxID=303405 RepID=A0A9K3KIN0_9STRA|nr:bZIP basic region leucine zipper domain containing protein [Nitzschia inconspicua]